ncbi:hypothetical protein VTO42DRAFT_4439 [Malbranchea cinnamomea]
MSLQDLNPVTSLDLLAVKSRYMTLVTFSPFICLCSRQRVLPRRHELIALSCLLPLMAGMTCSGTLTVISL